MLPNESLLQVLCFADYKTLVAAKLTGRRFLRLVTKFAEELARGLSFRVTFNSTYITLEDATVGAKSIGFEPRKQASLAAACRELIRLVGPHPVAELTFYGNTWSMPGVGVIFEAAPALKYAEELALHSPVGSAAGDSFNSFISSFAELKALFLEVYSDLSCRFFWTFIRGESARKLRLIKVSAMPETPTESMNISVLRLVQDCAKRPRPLGGHALELDFSEMYFSGAFGLLIIEELKGCRREVTFRMTTFATGGGLVLDDSDYTIDTATRYTSDKSGIIVEAEGREITIHSTGDISRKNPRRATNEEMSPTMPLVE